MTSRDFCYWLQGYFEISEGQNLDVAQTKIVKKHLSMVFEHEIDPSFGDDLKKLKKIHNPPGYQSAGGEPQITC